MILLEEALMAWVLEDYPYSVISKEKLSEQIFIFYSTKEYKNEKIGLIRKSSASPNDFNIYIGKLERAGVIVNYGSGSSDLLHYKDHLKNIYSISGKPEYSPQEAVCSVYPYGYISKINAMAWYGITDKIPKVIRFTCCSPAEWKKRSLTEIRANCDNPYVEPSWFIPKYPKNNDIFSLQLIVSSESSFTDPVKVRNSPIRVSSIGKTFIDMLRYPEECGGIDHVLETYNEYGKKYSQQIINELEVHGRKIDIARTGFVLQKISGVSSQRLTQWQIESKGTRGSSKILVPGQPFSDIFDEDWSLSLNTEAARQYGN